MAVSREERIYKSSNEKCIKGESRTRLLGGDLAKMMGDDDKGENKLGLSWAKLSKSWGRALLQL